MKQRLLSSFVLIIMGFSFLALMNDEPNGNMNSLHKISPINKNNLILQSRKLDTNNISAWFTNNGNFNRDPLTGNAGFEWPRGTGYNARFSSGLWMGCVVGNDTLTAVAKYTYDYKPGYVDNNGNPQGQFDTLYRIYRIERGDTTTPDYQNWPVNQGAYVNSLGKPFFLGTQTMFYVYTDAYPHSSGISSLASLKAQILQTNWCYTNVGLRDVIFTEFKVINRSNSTWTNTYIRFWTDDDLDNATDDRIGCDTLRELGYTYNADNSDQTAVGTKVLRSPIMFTGNNNDTVKYYSPPGSQNLRIKVGYKYTGMNVFNYYNNVTPEPADPRNNIETFRVIAGLWRTGQAWINPINGQTTKKVFSGDPVSGSGWIMSDGNDRRFLQGYGPFNMNANDTQSIIVAQVIARGSSNLNSITLLRDLSDHVQTIYNQNFQSVLSVKNISTEIPERFNLYQNYPNPFNPSTKIKFDISKTYNVKLTIYDVIGRKIDMLINQKLEPGTYEVGWDAKKYSSGSYFYRLETDDLSQVKAMILLK